MTETDVQRPLGILESSGLIRLATTNPELEYLFRHVLVQDAAYDSLLKQERRRLHLAVADTLEQLYPERRDELAAMLAYHCEAAGEAERALPLLVEAGGHALRRYANAEATGFFDRAADLVADGDDPALKRLRAEIALGRASAGFLSRPLAVSLAIIEPAVALAEELGDQALLAQALLWTSIILADQGVPYEPGSPFATAIDRTLAVAEATGNRQLRGTALSVLGRSSLMSRDPRRSTELLEEALTLTSAADFIGSSLAADSLAMMYAGLGEFDRADEAVERSRELALRSGDPKALIDSNIAASAVNLERGNFPAAIRLASDSALRADAIEAPMCSIVANFLAGTGELASGNFAGALVPLARSNQLSSDLGEMYFGTQSEAGMSTARCALGDSDSARVGWERTLGRARAMGDPMIESQILFDRALALAASPDPDWNFVLADLDGAIAGFERLGLRPRLARALVQRARLLDLTGRPNEARQSRERAAELQRELGIAEPGAADSAPSATLQD